MERGVDKLKTHMDYISYWFSTGTVELLLENVVPQSLRKTFALFTTGTVELLLILVFHGGCGTTSRIGFPRGPWNYFSYWFSTGAVELHLVLVFHGDRGTTSFCRYLQGGVMIDVRLLHHRQIWRRVVEGLRGGRGHPRQRVRFFHVPPGRRRVRRPDQVPWRCR